MRPLSLLCLAAFLPSLARAQSADIAQPAPAPAPEAEAQEAAAPLVEPTTPLLSQPATEAPLQVASSVTEYAHLSLVSTQRNITFFARDLRSEGELSELCRAPCEVSVPKGPYEFALTDGTNDPQGVGSYVLEQGGTLLAQYQSRDRLRRTGLGILAVSAIIGSSLSILASTCDSDDQAKHCKREDGFRVTGVTFLSAGVVGGLVMMFMPDKAKMRWLSSK